MNLNDYTQTIKPQRAPRVSNATPAVEPTTPPFQSTQALLEEFPNFGYMTIEEAQKEVDEWIKTVGVRYFNELTNMAQLTEEVGEVARIISRRYGEQSEKDSDKEKDLGEEFADVLFVLICMANQTGVDLTKAFHKRMEAKTERDKDRHKKNPKLQ